jgi:hypothetical protein
LREDFKRILPIAKGRQLESDKMPRRASYSASIDIIDIHVIIEKINVNGRKVYEK